MTQPETPETPQARLSPTVRALGLVSLFADISSEMVYPLNPTFLTKALGAPPWALGLIEGIAESTASLLKLVAGYFSDRSGRRKPFAVGGYLLGALGKPLIAMAAVWWHVLFARFVDRLGKGLRSAPRDALIAENCTPETRGRAFGFHRSMDTIGAVLGPFIGFWLLGGPGAVFSRDSAARLYWIAFVPGLIGVGLLAAFVRERSGGAGAPAKAPPGPLPAWRSLGAGYRRYLLIVALFSLGNSSDAFLLLRAQDMGVTVAQTLLLYSTFNLVEACLGYLAGSLSDRMDRRRMVAAGYAVFAVVYAGFALLHGAPAAWILFLGYGFYYTLTQGIQRAIAADLADPKRRATEIGMFHMIVGLAALPASLCAGLLYQLWHPAPFILGAVSAGLACVLLLGSRLMPSADAKAA